MQIIQGGMGVGVSGWRLARAVSRGGQLGVVSGTGLAIVLARRLQEGDPQGDVRRALGQFPYPSMARRVLERYFIPGGKPARQPYTLTPMPQMHPSPAFLELTVLANFVEVFLAKEGHDGQVGINYLEKLQIPTAPSLYGAMLAGVDYVLMGAGIPRFIPGMLDSLARGEAVDHRIDVAEAQDQEQFVCRFDPAAFCGEPPPKLRRPKFLAIIASATLALTLARKSNGQVDGFIIEGPTAGGHNAPPRGPVQLNQRGEPVYGPRDIPDLEKIRELGLPFWLAGGYATAEKLAQARQGGAHGIQVGTAFAFCEESGVTPEIKRQVLAISRQGRADVRTDRLASPTGFPFKVMDVPGTLSDAAIYSARSRLCDMGYLRQPYRRGDGNVGYRCPAEPVEEFVRKGGQAQETQGRLCICNALFATIGLGQSLADGAREEALVTAGDDVVNLARFIPPGRETYGAADVLNHLLATGQ